MNISFQKMFFTIGVIFMLFAILVVARPILILLTTALLISFILYPLAKRFESLRMNRITAAFLSILSVVLIFGGIIFFFSTQIIELTQEFSNFKDKIIRAFADVTLYINNNVNMVQNLEKDELSDRIKNWITESTGSLVKSTFTNTATILTGLLVTLIFIFLLLIYRDGLKAALVSFFPVEKHQRILNMFRSVQKVGQKYLVGMLLLVTILGFANSIGLLIIGLDNPFLFGFLGAALSIIPYIGTLIGAIIPILYAFVSFDSPWNAIAVAILFWTIQVISDNFLTPKIVGGSLKVNALAALLSLIIGAAIWGIAGMILFLPFVAMLRVVCEEYEELKPVALLIGTYDYESKKKNNFLTRSFNRIRDRLKGKNRT